MILLNLWCIINIPKNEIFACVFAGGAAHHSMMPYIIMLLQMLDLYVIGFYLFVVLNGLKLGNVGITFLITLAAGMIMKSFDIKNSNPAFDCIKDFYVIHLSILALFAIAWVMLFIDERIKTSHGSTAETTPLRL